MASLNAYVYGIVVDGVLRYIGKGTLRRSQAHMANVRSVCRRRAAGDIVKTTPFYENLVAAWVSGAEISEIIIVGNLSDKEAYSSSEYRAKQSVTMKKIWAARRSQRSGAVH